ncbi:MAG: hypothetical protein V4697_00900 [Patescibacteria group bacterium]
MNNSLFIHRAKPNPLGKDTAQHIPKPEQLLGEWVDLVNNSNAGINLGNYSLANLQFDSRCAPVGPPQIYWSGDAAITLGPGQIVRIHTGRAADWWVAHQEDKTGVHYHSCAERGSFVLNNRCGDTVSIWTKDRLGNWQNVDIASYDPNPPEGAILERSGSKLVVGVRSRLYA